MIVQLEQCQLHLPDWYDDRAEWEAEQKGWLQGVEVELAGERYPLFFYDPVRLAQDLDEAAKLDRPAVAEPGLVVVPAVTRDAVSRAVEVLANTGYFQHLKPITQPS